MKGEGRVVVVDGDYDILDMLARALRARGHHVALATDGRSGLKSAVELCADVVIVDREVRIIDVRTFVDVLRDNARTSDAHIFVMGTNEHAPLASIHGRAETIVKPFNAAEIAARVDEALESRRASTREQELRGDLSQVSLFDLLQVFGINRRTGKVLVESDGAAGEIWLDAGEIIDASAGHVVGEKALYRILRARGGQFLFSPDSKSVGTRRITGQVDHLLMEGARRTDELARLVLSLPPLVATLTLGDAASTAASGPPNAPLEAAPLEAALLALVEAGATLEELLDRGPAQDLEILEAVRGLLARGAVRVLDAKGKVAFCEADESATVRAAIVRQRRAGVEAGARVGVVASTLEQLEALTAAFSAIREHVPSPRPLEPAGATRYGSLGVLRVGGTELELFALPFEPALRPLWGITLAGATTLLLLDDAVDAEVEETLRSIDLRPVAATLDARGPVGLVDLLRDLLGLPPYTAPR